MLAHLVQLTPLLVLISTAPVRSYPLRCEYNPSRGRLAFQRPHRRCREGSNLAVTMSTARSSAIENDGGDDARATKRSRVIQQASTSSSAAATPTLEEMERRAAKMKSGAQNSEPLAPDEVDTVVRSLKNVAGENGHAVDWEKLSTLLTEVAHKSHKDWDETGRNSERLHDILLPGGPPSPSPSEGTSVAGDEASAAGVGTTGSTAGGGSAIDYPSNEPFRTKFERVLHDGNWDGAVRSAKSSRSSDGGGKADDECDRPWVVLVTGLNGIRKSTSVYEPWFPQVLSEALVRPAEDSSPSPPALSQLPTGSNSFFRQLDHMISILANEEFKQLYTITANENVDLYAKYKDGIFARYRTLSEMLGIILIREAQKEKINIMVETSGRDIAMFKYVNSFFDDAKEYRKLVLHFSIDDISFAEESVDKRMLMEMGHGRDALEKDDIRAIIRANAGGPYGSQVLRGVQADSDRVWKEISSGEGGDDDVGRGWYKASIEIRSHATEPWTATAIRPDGTRGETFKFPLRK